MAHKHLIFVREENVNDRHKRPDPRSAKKDAPADFGARLLENFERARSPEKRKDIGGFDARKLIKIKVRPGQRMPDLSKIPGIDVISQESEELVLAFASDEGLRLFEKRLRVFASSGTATRAELLYAIEDFDSWTPEDRKGPSLLASGYPPERNEHFILDAELWPQPNSADNRTLIRSFRDWAASANIEVLDSLTLPSLVLVRLRLGTEQANLLLEHRDVRQVDLPPRIGISQDAVTRSIDRLPTIEAPPDDAPPIAILDSGLTSGHPLLSLAVGDSQGFIKPQRDTVDNTPGGHGTFVAGLALHGDFFARLDEPSWQPKLRLFSGKVFDDGNNNDSQLVENTVIDAVRALHSQYGCRVFTLCYGDENRIYDGRHIRGLAYVLDHLSRELGVLFVVPTGNISSLPADPLREYPAYLFRETARLIDPATALHAITVGAVSRYGQTRQAQRHQNTIEDIPVAKANCPAPFSRTGYSINDAIKPDLVEHGGNYAIGRDGSGKHPRKQGLGVISLNSGFSQGNPLWEEIGTSCAAPLLANKAAILAGALAQQSIDTIRALLAAHAAWPAEAVDLLKPNKGRNGLDKVLRAIGYGIVDDRALYASLDNEVTLIAEASIGNDKHHFYELPIPNEFWEGNGRRTRQITVALAHRSEVKTTRIGYLASRISFSLVTASDLTEVAKAFRKGRDEGKPERTQNRLISSKTRNTGSLQMSRWEFRSNAQSRNKIFVVVTRQDAGWSDRKDDDEQYSLAVVLRDHENEASQLYARVDSLIQARARERERIRIRV